MGFVQPDWSFTLMMLTLLWFIENLISNGEVLEWCGIGIYEFLLWLPQLVFRCSGSCEN